MHPTNYKVAWWGLTALVIAVIVGFLVVRTHPVPSWRAHESSERSQTRSEAVSGERSNTGNARAIAQTQGLATKIGLARTAKQANAIIQIGLATRDPVAYDAVLKLDGLCIPVLGKSQDTNSAFARAVTTYCQGYSSEFSGKLRPEQIEKLEQLQKNGLDTLLGQELDFVLGKEGKVAAMRELDGILQAGRPEEVGVALSYAGRKELVPAQLEGSIRELDPLGTRRRVILDIAGNLYFCRNSSTCGSPGLYALLMCFASQGCTQQISYDAALRAAYPGADYDAAIKLVREIESTYKRH